MKAMFVVLERVRVESTQILNQSSDERVRDEKVESGSSSMKNQRGDWLIDSFLITSCCVTVSVFSSPSR